MATARQDRTAGFAQARSLVLGFTGLALVIGLVMGLVVARSVSANLGIMVEAAGKISDGDVTQDVVVASHDETGEVAAAFRRMIAYLKELAGIASRVAGGDLEAEVAPRSERDTLQLGKKSGSRHRLLPLLRSARCSTFCASKPHGRPRVAPPGRDKESSSRNSGQRCGRIR